MEADKEMKKIVKNNKIMDKIKADKQIKPLKKQRNTKEKGEIENEKTTSETCDHTNYI